MHCWMHSSCFNTHLFVCSDALLDADADAVPLLALLHVTAPEAQPVLNKMLRSWFLVKSRQGVRSHMPVLPRCRATHMLRMHFLADSYPSQGPFVLQHPFVYCKKLMLHSGGAACCWRPQEQVCTTQPGDSVGRVVQSRRRGGRS